MSNQDHAYALPVGFMLEEYRLGEVLGSGGFGITYYAWDTHLDKAVAIKEYLPNEFAVRYEDTTVAPKSSSDAATYEWGLRRFLEEAQVLAGFDHPNINRVYRRLEAHGTAYMVLEYLPGESLSARLKRTGRLSPEEVWRLFNDILSGLSEVHRQGYVHRDIKPGNIMFREDGGAVLLDFGAARQAVGQRSRSITSILTPFYAPIEQYDQKGDDVGPWSDFYALGVVAYRCVTGVGEGELLDAVARARVVSRGEHEQDLRPVVVLAEGGYDRRLLEAIDWCMRVDERKRPQGVVDLEAALAGGVSKVEGEPKPAPEQKPKQKPEQKHPAVWAAVGAVVALLLGFGIWQGFSPSPPPRVAAEPGSLVLELSPADAQVMLPDIESPYRSGLALPAGEYRVVVRQAGYEEFEGTVRIEAGRRTTRAIVLRRTEPERAEGEVFRDSLRNGGEGPEMVVLPTGSFRMGDLSGGGNYDEKPIRTVTITRRIAMGRYEVSFDDYDRFADATTGVDRPGDEGWGRGTRPVINVSQEDAQAYAQWLSAQTGKRYRLPSEAEWEYAARSGTTTRYSWGDSITCNQARYGRLSNGECSDSSDGTVAVGRFAANAFGLYDMHGNVWEWVEDCYVNTYTGAPSDGSARTTGCYVDSDGDSFAVLRGGSWLNFPRRLRSAGRVRNRPSARYDWYGFRLVQDINP